MSRFRCDCFMSIHHVIDVEKTVEKISSASVFVDGHNPNILKATERQK